MVEHFDDKMMSIQFANLRCDSAGSTSTKQTKIHPDAALINQSSGRRARDAKPAEIVAQTGIALPSR